MLLSIRDLTISFAGLSALEGVSFDVPPYTVFGLIGPNGAGKTTLLNCLSRIYTPDRGTARFDDKDIFASPIHGIARLGICRTFQNLELFSEASVRENVLVGCIYRHRPGLAAELLYLPVARRAHRTALKEVDALLERLELDACRDQPVSSLPFAQQKMVELARALAGKPRLLLLDEPAAGMNAVETRRQGELLRSLIDDHGMTVLLVEHDMTLVMSICDIIVALDHGEKICEGAPDVVRSDPQLIRAYLGEEVADA